MGESKTKRSNPAHGVSDGTFSTFEDLYVHEVARMEGRPVSPEGSRPPIISQGTGGEPWVEFTSKDHFGLALSGGGIRSATFNLGLLQALKQLGVLAHVEYLSTVSGGGYVGGFWTAWLQRRQQPTVKNPERKEPEQDQKRDNLEQLNQAGGKRQETRPEDVFPSGDERPGGEKSEVRHLREFSRFLLPRVGIMETEFWSIVMTVLGGMLPSLLAATSVLVLAWYAWVELLVGWNWANANSKYTYPFWALLIYFTSAEARWRLSGKSEQPDGTKQAKLTDSRESYGYCTAASLGATLATVGFILSNSPWPGAQKIFALLLQLPVGLDLVAALALTTVGLLFVRVAVARFMTSPDWVPFLVGFERGVTRLLALTCACLCVATLWWAAGWLSNAGSNWSISVSGGAAVTTGLFLWLRKWLLEPVQETHGGGLLRKALGFLKRATPKFLATLAWVLIFVLVAAGVQWSLRRTNDWHEAQYWFLPGSSLLVVFLTALFFDPARVGLHEYYRSRIARCYLGASNTSCNISDCSDYERAAQNRQTSERRGDDLTLGQLGADRLRIKPLHLVCTAANDISGDPLGTLYRGARSAVLSVHGITLGDYTARQDDLRLSSALTASAAAFNSHMGRISMDLGPAVAFLMSAFNLRLGLWVPHPARARRKRVSFPGRFFFYELLGRSRTNRKGHLHLSDGNHFENFGLYELIRRHCRHIIVSDCGADVEVAFDDLANVLRRVREDFGVEIDLDISSLRPGPDGLATQHAVVGTIHYNGLAGMDKGTILFFKPALTGDEPPDVLQYRTRNTAFPHEGTSDQFYDEAQWESYRRLGEHAGRSVLGFLDKPESKRTSTSVDRVFRDARSRWHPAPANLNEGFLAMSERCAALEQDLAENGSHRLRTEFFAEALELSGPVQPRPDAAETAEKEKVREAELEDEIKVLGHLLRVTQIMEDVWVSGDFEQYWSHPLNEGWMNYFHRWAATPSFRRWWPVISSIYGPGFREFAKERFRVGVTDPVARSDGERPIQGGELNLRRVGTGPDDFKEAEFTGSRLWREFVERLPELKQARQGTNPDENKITFVYELSLRGHQGQLDSGHRLLVGFVLVTEKTSCQAMKAEWHANEFFVPPTLHGGGIVSRLLDAILKHYERRNLDGTAGSKKFIEALVRFGPPKTTRTGEKPHHQKLLGPAARHERMRDIEFYKSRRFCYLNPEDPETGAISLHRPLKLEEDSKIEDAGTTGF